MARNKKKEEYAKYLQSDEWKALRKQARERAGNTCEFCQGPPDHVHHVKYPKRFSEDHVDNLVVVCETCHEKLHGIRKPAFFAEWLVTYNELKWDDKKGAVFVATLTPMPNSIPTTISRIEKTSGEEIAKFILDIFDGDTLEIGKECVKEFPLYGSYIQDFIQNTSVNELIHSMACETGTPLNSSESILHELFCYIGQGVHLFPCRLGEKSD